MRAHLAASTVLLWLATAACVSLPQSDDAPGADGGSAPDVEPTPTPDETVLVFRFQASPSLPGEVEGDFGAEIEIEEIRIALADVRAVGDAAPGDARTAVPELQLGWYDGNAPPDLAFAGAPPGLYSKLLARLVSYELHGEVTVGEDSYDLRIKDQVPLVFPISIDLAGIDVGVGQTTALDIWFDAGSVVAPIDWDQADQGGGKIEIDDQSALIDLVRALVAAAFAASA
jgi:hypothetical protein